MNHHYVSSFALAANCFFNLRVDPNVDWMFRVPGIRRKTRTEVQIPIEIAYASYAWMFTFHSNRSLFIVSSTQYEAFRHIDEIRKRIDMIPEPFRVNKLQNAIKSRLENSSRTRINSMCQPAHGFRGQTIDSVVLYEPNRFNDTILRGIQDAMEPIVWMSHSYKFVVDSTREMFE